MLWLRECGRLDRTSILLYHDKKNADMSEQMQQDLVECATQVLEKYSIDNIATYMEKENIYVYNLTMFLKLEMFILP
uniref:Uncharacterized protein n=1 Tax=Equus asinus TaxID=9793 RepID=A0A9L0K655_EQUAS